MAKKKAWIGLIIALVIAIIIFTICAVIFMKRRRSKKAAVSQVVDTEVKEEQSRSMMNETYNGEGETAGTYTDEKIGITSRIGEH
ncbi:hypothetical protein H2198_004698 [Neophaeococcomyces mojaviensis]|uniref:Uncharacterized protein n=1 Tax=Neophaeococcomyces mojaviensis TaxID=3383035 RepID=A0ACC3A7T0_9EURO|nr:hypothetical protein H2198_004698 [Knufia sp. JES_112]